MLVLLSGCAGFHPQYGESQTVEHLKSVKVHSIADRSGQILYGKLQDKIPPTDHKSSRYDLHVTLTHNTRAVGVDRDLTSSRSEYKLTADVTLSDRLGAKKTQKTVCEAIGNYNTSKASIYATFTAEGDAKERAIDVVADCIFSKLSLYVRE